MWGGEIFERGVVIHRKRPRGRPSKADLARDRAYAAASPPDHSPVGPPRTTRPEGDSDDQPHRPPHAAPPTRPVPNEGTAMLLHEALARSRMREAEQAAREYALARALTAGRRWAVLARYAQRRRAERAERHRPSRRRAARRSTTGSVRCPMRRHRLGLTRCPACRTPRPSRVGAPSHRASRTRRHVRSHHHGARSRPWACPSAGRRFAASSSRRRSTAASGARSRAAGRRRRAGRARRACPS